MNISPSTEAICNKIIPTIKPSNESSNHLLIGVAIGMCVLLSGAIIFTGYMWMRREFELINERMVKANNENNQKLLDSVTDLIRAIQTIPKFQQPQATPIKAPI